MQNVFSLKNENKLCPLGMYERQIKAIWKLKLANSITVRF